MGHQPIQVGVLAITGFLGILNNIVCLDIVFGLRSYVYAGSVLPTGKTPVGYRKGNPFPIRTIFLPLDITEKLASFRIIAPVTLIFLLGSR
jgi:hypothetical protein